MSVIDQFAFAIGLVIVVLTLTQVLFAMVLPRRPSGIERMTLVVNRAVRLAFVARCRGWPRRTRARTDCWRRPHRSP